eukprot:TRINITY_DN1086_c0_g2_i1.p1 TRINITY_DN1086_c0_g2~~TRINITY_DN1086_c0_g2_i1.p1  ORF type:complete len:164 (+),score=50.44 TRINITY_DN1086_c0_g2_i1:59-550(+)
MAACGKPGCKWCAQGQCWGSKGGKGKGGFGGNMSKGGGGGLAGDLAGGLADLAGGDPNMLEMLMGLMGAGGGGGGGGGGKGNGKVINKFNGGGMNDAGGYKKDPNANMEGKPGPKGEDPSTGRWTWGSNGAKGGKKWKWKPFLTEEQRVAKEQKALLTAMMMS